MPAQLYDWQLGNAQGAVILGDAGISLTQLSSGSYQKMLDALESGSSFSFSKNASGKYDVLTSNKEDFFGNLLGGSNNDFLGSLFGGSKNTKSDQPKTAQESFWSKYGNMLSQIAGGNYSAAGATFAGTEAGQSAGKAAEAWNEKYGGVFIRIAIGVVGVVLLIIGVVFMFKGEATNLVVGNVGKAIKGK